MNLPELSGYVIWLLFSEQDQSKLISYMKRLREYFNSPMFVPHITLLGSIREMNDARQLAKSLSRKSESFSVKATGFGWESNPYRCLYVQLQRHQNLLLLRNEALNQQQVKAAPLYNPHISLLYGKADDQQKPTFAAEVPEAGTHEYTISSIAVCHVDGKPEDWKIKFSKSLGDA